MRKHTVWQVEIFGGLAFIKLELLVVVQLNGTESPSHKWRRMLRNRGYSFWGSSFRTQVSMASGISGSTSGLVGASKWYHDDVIKWKYFPRRWTFVRGIYRSEVNSPHKDQWRGALMFSLICVWINGWVNNQDGGDLRAIALIMTWA